jgi:hypothetical protein
MSRVLIRVNTSMGSRTIISQDVLPDHAWEIAHSLAGLGLQIHVTEEATPVEMQALIKRLKRKVAKVPERPSAIVTKLHTRKEPSSYAK